MSGEGNVFYIQWLYMVAAPCGIPKLEVIPFSSLPSEIQ